MKYVAIDYGLKRTGLAVSDPSGMFAFPRCTLKMTTKARFFDELMTCIALEKPSAIVIGLPRTANGEDSLTTRQVRNFAARLARRTSLPLFWMDEYLSSYAAESDLHEVGKHTDMRAVVDQQAAVRILESFLALEQDQRRPIDDCQP